MAGLVLIARERRRRVLEQPREARERGGISRVRARVPRELGRHRGAVHFGGAPPASRRPRRAPRAAIRRARGSRPSRRSRRARRSARRRGRRPRCAGARDRRRSGRSGSCTRRGGSPAAPRRFSCAASPRRRRAARPSPSRRRARTARRGGPRPARGSTRSSACRDTARAWPASPRAWARAQREREQQGQSERRIELAERGSSWRMESTSGSGARRAHS